jgi:hypothetical protein
MAKKKSPKTKRMCFACDGMGHKCDCCGESEAACQCPIEDDGDGAQILVDCDDCFGTGIASADIEEKDLEPGMVEKWKKERTE